MTGAYAVASVWLVVVLGSVWVLRVGERNKRRRRVQHVPPARPVITYVWPEPGDKRGWP